MAYVGSKGYYVKQLKENNIRTADGKRLESLKTHELLNMYYKYVKQNER